MQEEQISGSRAWAKYMLRQGASGVLRSVYTDESPDVTIVALNYKGDVLGVTTAKGGAPCDLDIPREDWEKELLQGFWASEALDEFLNAKLPVVAVPNPLGALK